MSTYPKLQQIINEVEKLQTQLKKLLEDDNTSRFLISQELLSKNMLVLGGEINNARDFLKYVMDYNLEHDDFQGLLDIIEGRYRNLLESTSGIPVIGKQEIQNFQALLRDFLVVLNDQMERLTKD